jgi:hypothetical protein
LNALRVVCDCHRRTRDLSRVGFSSRKSYCPARIL